MDFKWTRQEGDSQYLEVFDENQLLPKASWNFLVELVVYWLGKAISGNLRRQEGEGLVMYFFRNVNIDWIGRKTIFIGASFALFVASVISLAVKGGPHYGIDFSGGTLVYVKFKDKAAFGHHPNRA